VDGGSQKEVSTTLQYLLDRHPAIRLVILETSIWNVCNMADHPFWPFQAGFHERSPSALAKYLVSGETLGLSLSRLAFTWQGWFAGTFTDDVRRVHRWIERMEGQFHNPEHIRQQFAYSVPRPEEPLHPSASLTAAQANNVLQCFEANIMTIVRAYPQVQFLLFNPPVFQWLQWYRHRKGDIDAWNLAEERIAIQLPKNARYFDFYAAGEIQNDCMRYMDMGHFDQESADLIVKWLFEGRLERTASTNDAISAAVRDGAQERVSCPP
jgi:hypothetical protein